MLDPSLICDLQLAAMLDPYPLSSKLELFVMHYEMAEHKIKLAEIEEKTETAYLKYKQKQATITQKEVYAENCF